MRGATSLVIFLEHRQLISIHTPHAGSDGLVTDKYKAIGISIHTPHAGSDVVPLKPRPQTNISIHTPHAGSDHVTFCYLLAIRYFNPHSPCGERPNKPKIVAYTEKISIHTPHAGSDSKNHTFINKYGIIFVQYCRNIISI